MTHRARVIAVALVLGGLGAVPPAYDGVPDRQERADLIACLRQVDRAPACRGSPPLQR